MLGITVTRGIVDWGDFDADGDMDILAAGIIREICECGKIRIASRPIQLEGPAHLRDREQKRSD